MEIESEHESKVELKTHAIPLSCLVWTTIFTGSLLISDYLIILAKFVLITIIVSPISLGGFVIMAFLGQRKKIPGILFVIVFLPACCCLMVIFSFWWVLSFIISLPIALTYLLFLIMISAKKNAMERQEGGIVYWSCLFLLVSIISFAIFSIVSSFIPELNSAAHVLVFIVIAFFVFVPGWLFVLNYDDLLPASRQDNWKSAYKEFVMSNVFICTVIIGHVIDVLAD